MENKAFNFRNRFGKWMKKYRLKWGMYKVLGTQAHMRQVQRHVSGRSMIEMLGVLAIIGVLSIGGLYAYRQAMNRYKAAEIAQFINRIHRASLEICPEVISNCQLLHIKGGDPSSSDTRINQQRLCAVEGADMCEISVVDANSGVVPTEPSAYWFAYTLAGNAQNITFQIRKLSEGVCRELVRQPFYRITEMWVVGKTSVTLGKTPMTKWTDAQLKNFTDACNGGAKQFLLRWRP